MILENVNVIDGGNQYTRIGGDPKYIHCVLEDGSEKEFKK